MTRFLIVIAGCVLVMAAACSRGVPYPTCAGEKAYSPNRDCYAYYYKTDFGSDGFVTQAMIMCSFPEHGRLGGSIVAYENEKDPGIGFAGKSDDTLEVLLRPDAKIAETLQSGASYAGKSFNYIYSDLTVDNPSSIGCVPQ